MKRKMFSGGDEGDRDLFAVLSIPFKPLTSTEPVPHFDCRLVSIVTAFNSRTLPKDLCAGKFSRIDEGHRHRPRTK